MLAERKKCVVDAEIFACVRQSLSLNEVSTARNDGRQSAVLPSTK